MMPLQRACAAESQVRNKSSNGPLRVQSNVREHRVFCNVGPASEAGDMLVSCKSTADAVKQGGTADKNLFVLDRLSEKSVRDFFCANERCEASRICSCVWNPK